MNDDFIKALIFTIMFGIVVIVWLHDAKGKPHRKYIFRLGVFLLLSASSYLVLQVREIKQLYPITALLFFIGVYYFIKATIIEKRIKKST
jgi:hypothetical protein